MKLTEPRYSVPTPYHRLAKQMRKIIEVENKLQTTRLFNLHNGKFEAIKVELQPKNLKQLYSLLAKLPAKNNTRIKGSALKAYVGFVKQLKNLLETYGTQWDMDAIAYQKSPSSYRSSVNTRYLINAFNHFVRASRLHKIYLLKHSQTSYRFTLQKPIKHEQVAPVFQVFRDKTIPDLPLFHAQPLKKQAIRVLNNYVECINKSIVQNSHLVTYITNHSKIVREIRQGKSNTYPSSFSHHYYYPRSQFCKARQLSITLPTPYRNVLNTRLNQLEEILKEMTGLDYELNHYLKNKGYQTDNLAKSQKALCRYQYLFNIFDDKCSVLATNIDKIRQAYLSHKKPLPVTTEMQDFLRILDFGKPVMDAAHKFLRKGANHLFDKHLTDSLIYAFYNPVMKSDRRQRKFRSARRTESRIKRFVKAAELITKADSKDQVSTQNISELYSYNNLIEYYNNLGKCKCSKNPGSLLKRILYPRVLSLKNPCDTTKTKQVEPPKIISRKNNQGKINMTSMQGFAPNNLMLLLDVSGSMRDKNKLPLLKKSFKYLVNIMRPEDEVSIVVYAGDAAVVLKPTSATQQEQINTVIDHLRSRGKTNVKAGFKLAYKWMHKNYKEKGNNRIILATDGEFPVDKHVYKLVEKRAEKGIYLSVFSFGNHHKKYKSLQQLVDKGKGNYEHIDPNNANYKLVKEAQSTQMK